MPKKCLPTHTDDGTPIVNVTLTQIRKQQSTKGLVRIPQLAERSKCYVDAAKVIGEREALALPYHGGRMWKCEVKLSDPTGATGSNYPTKSPPIIPPRKQSTTPTPLFRWYRHSLQLATLPHILQDIIEVEHKMTQKKKWTNHTNDDEDSSDEEWEEVEPTMNVMEVSGLTTSAFEDSTHPLPTISRTWISPDLQRFHSRKSAMAHSRLLVERDILIDRILYGYGKNGVRLRPAKPTRKQALEAGMARFLRDGLWVVGQEEMWIERRRERFNRKAAEKKGEEGEMEVEDGRVLEEKLNNLVKREEMSDGSSVGSGGAGNLANLAQDTMNNSNNSQTSSLASGESPVATAAIASDQKESEDAAARQTVQQYDQRGLKAAVKSSDIGESTSSSNTDPDMVAVVKSNDTGESKHIKVRVKQQTASNNISEDKLSKSVTPNDSDVSSHEETIPKKPKCRRSYIEPLPPSTHYRLNPLQIEKCYTACREHYENVMFTVKARSLHHELADGFDVLRERGKGRYDMELPQFDTEEYSFLTNPKNAAWMPIIHKILGEDAILVHKGCFLSLPGSETQVYHQDGVHLHKKCQKPCHAVNVFIPLVDYDMSNGPTEFSLGSHYLGHENYVKEMAYTPLVEAGTPVIFDYRLGHRGLRNYSQNPRPVVYLTYSSVASGKEFRDEVNFSRKRYRKLGEFVEKPLSREERAKKRRL